MTARAAERSGPELRRLPFGYLLVAAILPVLMLALLATVLITRVPGTSATSVGQVAPDFSLADLDGNPIHLSDLRGRPVVVNFWASWCGPCVEEFPLFEEAARRYADQGLAVIGIVYQDRSEAARDFMVRNGATWPAAMDPGGRVAQAYGIIGPPETFFIGRDGTIVARQFGQISAGSLDEKLAAIMDEE